MDYTVHGIRQVRILEWVALPSPGDLPNPGFKSRSPMVQEDSLPAEPPGKPGCDMRPRPSANGVHVEFKMQYFLNPRLYNLWEKGL